MNNQLVLICEHDERDLLLYRYEWPRLRDAPQLLILESGEEALDFLRRCAETYSGEPSLVLCERELPDGGGLEVLKFIKRNSALAHIPVITLGESVTPQARQVLIGMGASDCWQKPISLGMLDETLASLHAMNA